MMTGAAGAACLTLAACGSEAGVSVTAPSSTAASPTGGSGTGGPTGSSGAAVPGQSASGSAAFEPGQCYDSTIDWKLVPCDQPHKLEIMQVVQNAEFGGEVLKRSALRTWTCNNALGAYLGDPVAVFSRVLAHVVPTAVDPKSSSQIVCAAAMTKENDNGYEEITYPLKNIVKDKGYVNFRVCTAERPSQTDPKSIVPCSKPHAAETIGGYVIGQANTPYPGEPAADKTSYQKCKALAKTYLGGVERTDVIAASNHSGAGPWSRGTTLTACFVETPKGTFVKPLKDMKNEPLSKYQ